MVAKAYSLGQRVNGTTLFVAYTTATHTKKTILNPRGHYLMNSGNKMVENGSDINIYAPESI